MHTSRALTKEALKAGATIDEITEALKFCIVQSVQSCSLGVPILSEEIVKLSATPKGVLVMMMNRAFRSRLSAVFAAITHGLIGLVRELAPIVLYFFIAFLLIFLMFKLFVAQYSIEFFALSKAAIAALILGKVIPLLDWAQSGHSFGTHRRAVVVGCKTLIYALVVIVLGIGEKTYHGVHEAGSLQGGISLVIANASLDRFLGMVLLVSLIVGSYLVLQEIDRAMGKGALFSLFFKPPLVGADRELPSKRG
jgi:hypothetical protein